MLQCDVCGWVGLRTNECCGEMRRSYIMKEEPMTKLDAWLKEQKLNHQLDFEKEQAIAIIEKLKEVLETYAKHRNHHPEFGFQAKDHTDAKKVLNIDPLKLGISE